MFRKQIYRVAVPRDRGALQGGTQSGCMRYDRWFDGVGSCEFGSGTDKWNRVWWVGSIPTEIYFLLQWLLGHPPCFVEAIMITGWLLWKYNNVLCRAVSQFETNSNFKKYDV